MVLLKTMGVEITFPNEPRLFMEVQGAATSFKIVPWGMVPLDAIAVIFLVDPRGAIELAFKNILELETGLTVEPATEVDNVRLTGAGEVLVLIMQMSLTTMVIGS